MSTISLPVASFSMCARVHRPRRRPFDSVARRRRSRLPWHGHLNLFSLGFHYRRAAQVRAAREDQQDPSGSRTTRCGLVIQEGCSIPSEKSWEADGENGGWFEERTRQEEPQEHQKVYAEVAALYRRPNHLPPASFVRRRRLTRLIRRGLHRVLSTRTMGQRIGSGCWFVPALPFSAMKELSCLRMKR